MDRLNHRLAEERGAKEKESTATTTLHNGTQYCSNIVSTLAQ